jgi:ferredoxin--NADP+ reductase
MKMDEWIDGTVIEKHHWSDKLYSLRVKAPVMGFIAGQFTRLALEIDGERVARGMRKHRCKQPGHFTTEKYH